jgi:hypothetical protein
LVRSNQRGIKELNRGQKMAILYGEKKGMEGGLIYVAVRACRILEPSETLGKEREIWK